MTRSPQALGAALVFGCGALLAGCASGTGSSTGTGGTTGTAGTSGAAGVAGTTGAAGTTGVAGTTETGAAGRGGAAGSAAGTGGSGGGGAGGAAGTTGSAGRGGTGGAAGTTGNADRGGSGGAAGTAGSGGRGGTGGAAGTTGSGGRGGGGTGGTTGSAGTNGCASTPASGPVGTFKDPVTATNISPPNPPGISLKDTDGNLVNAHGGGIIKVCDTFYLHGEYFLSTTTDNNFNGFAMYSSKDLATWKNEGLILPQQSSGELGPNRKGERPHIIQCPATGEFVLYAHAADTTYQADKEVVYATSSTVNGQYTYKGTLKNAGGTPDHPQRHERVRRRQQRLRAHRERHTSTRWPAIATAGRRRTSTRQVNGTTGGIEAPTVFKAGSTYYWIGSDKTGWRANDDFYSTAPAMTGPWTYQGYLAPQGKLTWMTQSTWVMPIAGSQGTTYVYLGRPLVRQPGHVRARASTTTWRPTSFSRSSSTERKIGLPTYQVSWKLDVGAGTWTAN